MIERKIWLMTGVQIMCAACYLLAQSGQSPEPLTIEKIMQDPAWIGRHPRSVHWSDDSQWIYFDWSYDHSDDWHAGVESLYVAPRSGGKPRRLSLEERKEKIPQYGHYNRNRTQKVYEKNGDLFILDIRKGSVRQITNTLERESNPRFTRDEKKVSYEKDNNLYLWHIDDGLTVQLTDFSANSRMTDEKRAGTEQEAWLSREELKLIRVLKERKEKEAQTEHMKDIEKPERPREIPVRDQWIRGIQLSPDARFVTFTLMKRSRHAKRTVVPNYVTESGFTEEIPSRTKVWSNSS